MPSFDHPSHLNSWVSHYPKFMCKSIGNNRNIIGRQTPHKDNGVAAWLLWQCRNLRKWMKDFKPSVKKPYYRTILKCGILTLLHAPLSHPKDQWLHPGESERTWTVLNLILCVFSTITMCKNCNLSSKNIPHVILFELLNAWQVNGWEMESQADQTEQLNTWERIKKKGWVWLSGWT